MSLKGSLLIATLALAGLSACVTELDDPTLADAAADLGEDGLDTKAIVGGDSRSITTAPWQISLQSGGGHFCGGSIIAPGWVVTAQHCIEGARPSSLRVVAGVSRLSQASSGQRVGVSQIIPYPGYVSPEYGKDIALLRLSSNLTFNQSVQAIPVAVTADNATPAGAAATVTGWGTIRSGGSSPDQLLGVEVPVVSPQAAQSAYSRETLTSDQLAAGASGRDACQGDSGGPLTALSARGRVLVGVVSWGYGCGDARYPGLYARVTSFADWIAGQTGITVGGGATTPDPVEPDPVEPDPVVDAGTYLDRTLQGGASTFQHFRVDVPAGLSSLTFAISGSSGDADLYVRKAAQPTTSRFDCRPYTPTSTEACNATYPSAGTWYVSVRGYTAYSGLRLVVSGE